MKLLWISIIIVIVIMILIGYCCKEAFTTADFARTQTSNTTLPTIVGGTVASKMIFNNRSGSTVVRKMLGDTTETIVLLHNAPFNMQVWYPIYMYVQQLKNKGEKIPTIISYDLMGHGTAWVPVPDEYNDNNPQNYAFTLQDHVQDLSEIYKSYIGSGKITLCGYGLGGLVAQAFALDNSNLIDRLYILGATIGPTTTGIADEMQYMVDWIAKNAQVTYLTMQEQFVDWNLCLWFKNNNPLICPNPENRQDDTNTFDTYQYLLASKMYRLASAETYLQVDKLMGVTDLRDQWASARVPFSVTFLVPDKDHYINLEEVKSDLEIVEKASPETRLYVVSGKHGFPLIYPDYIYQLVMGKDMAKNSLTVDIIN